MQQASFSMASKCTHRRHCKQSRGLLPIYPSLCYFIIKSSRPHDDWPSCRSRVQQYNGGLSTPLFFEGETIFCRCVNRARQETHALCIVPLSEREHPSVPHKGLSRQNYIFYSLDRKAAITSSSPLPFFIIALFIFIFFSVPTSPSILRF